MKWFPAQRARKHSDQDQDRARAAKRAFDEKIAALRKATGKKEHRVLPFICARLGRPYGVIFERVSPAHKFQIARLEKEKDGEGRSGLLGRLFAQGVAASESFDAAEFDVSGLYCPWCATKGDSVYCTQCEQQVCRGRTRTLDNGTKLFACHDGCGASGTLSPYGKVHGAKRSRAMAGARRLLSGASGTRRGGSNRKRLTFGK